MPSEPAPSSIGALATALVPPGWDEACRRRSVQVFGAGGRVGRELVALLVAAGHAPRNLALFGRQPRSLTVGGHELAIRRAGRDVPGADVAFLCTPPEAAYRLAAVLTSLGTRVVDLSGAHRGQRQVPLVAGGIGFEALGTFTDLVGLAHPSAGLLASPLAAIDRSLGWKELGVTVIQGVEVETEPAPALPGGAPPTSVTPAWGGRRPDPEAEIAHDLRVLLGHNELPLDVHVIHVPGAACEGFAVRGVMRRPPRPGELARVLARAPRVRLEEGASDAPVVLEPGLAAGPWVTVGRIRAGSRGPASLCFVAVGDRLRLGTAAAALEVAAHLPPSA